MHVRDLHPQAAHLAIFEDHWKNLRMAVLLAFTYSTPVMFSSEFPVGTDDA